MNISNFFIDRPIFASVLSIIITIVGLVSLTFLAINQYPNIAPPTVVVSASYPGATPETIASSVAAPIEQQVNGVDNMLYMLSTSSASGNYTLTVTFALNTDPNINQVLVQNRVALAQPQLPQQVLQTGVTVLKQSPAFILAVNLISPKGEYDALWLGNYAYLQVMPVLNRLDGVGNINLFGYQYSMRIWLNPDKMASLGLTTNDVTEAVENQNVQVSAGMIGQAPTTPGTEIQLSLVTQGWLVEPEQFGNIVVKTGQNGQIVYLRDIARIDLGAQTYSIYSMFDGQPAATLGIFQRPGTNAVTTSEQIRAAMKELEKQFPPGLEYRIVYDTTVFVKESINEVFKTLRDAIILVAIVVLAFLQTWRAAIIPLIAVPVAIIGTFAAMAMLGFSLNTISLFGLVLAIGIVVDDAIVVIENVERNLEAGLMPKEAAKKAMTEVTGPIVAVALVLTSVFVPTAFITGISGEFYRQFALTIAVSTVISAFNSLTFSPALAALIIQPHGAKPDAFQRFLNATLGWFFRWFNNSFKWATGHYSRAVGRLIRVVGLVLFLYLGLLALTGFGFKVTPIGFIPSQDQGYLIVNAQLSGTASLDRTAMVTKKVAEIARKTEGVAHAITFNGYSFVNQVNQTNIGSLIVILDSFEERNTPQLTSTAILRNLMAEFSVVPEAEVIVFPPPPVQGIGSTGGFKLMIEDRSALGLAELASATDEVIKEASAVPGMLGMYSSLDINTPRLYIDIDREQAKTMNVELSNVFNTLGVFLGSQYVSQLSLFDFTFWVTMQADAPYRMLEDQILQLQTKNMDGQMFPLRSIATITDTTGPLVIQRYNMYTAADVSGNSVPSISSGQQVSIMTEICNRVLPPGMAFEWTNLTYQQITAGNTAVFIFPLCVLFVFLTLAAQYESWSLPLAIILIVPMVLLASLVGVLIRGMDNNVLTQIGFIVLTGMACKNAILIVEFAKENMEKKGMNRFDAAVEACHLRLRPILMTSFAFIMGVWPLVISHGAGYEMRQTLGTAVFSGMLGVTLFGLFLTPVFFVWIEGWMEKLAERKKKSKAPAEGGGPASHPA